MKIHPVFHISLLERASQDPYPGQQVPPPPPVIVDDEEYYYVEEVLNSRIYRRRLQYLVKWVGYTEPDWQPAENLRRTDAVNKFHIHYPEKPGPLADEE